MQNLNILYKQCDLNLFIFHWLTHIKAINLSKSTGNKYQGLYIVNNYIKSSGQRTLNKNYYLLVITELKY